MEINLKLNLHTTTDGIPAANIGFKKLAVQWLNKVQFSNQTFVQVDSFVLRNRQLLKPANRYKQPYQTDRTNINRQKNSGQNANPSQN